jgi:phage protein D
MFEGNSVNNPDIQSEGRAPRGLIKVNNIIVPFSGAEVDQTNFYLASTFRVNIPIGSLPQELSLSYFSSTPAILIEVFAGFPLNPLLFTEDELNNLILGGVDEVQISFPENMIVLSGRDLTSKFIDNKTTEKFQNHTSSEIVKILAARRGLKADVTNTSTIVGKYYQIDHVRLTDETSEWDLLTFLAQEEGFNVYVKGMTLFFHPLPSEKDKPYLITLNRETFLTLQSSNAKSLKMGRNLTIAKDVIVKVRSWNMKQKKGFTVTVKATHNKNTVLAGAAQPIGDAQVFTYRFANLTKQQALEKAQKLLRQISSHEMNLSLSLVGDNILSNQNVIQLQSTNSNFDQFYFPTNITRSIEMDGFTMTVDAKNHQPNTETTL